MKPRSAPPVPKSDSLSPWQEHWLKIAKDNPQLITNRARNKKANEEWLKLYGNKLTYP